MTKKIIGLTEFKNPVSSTYTSYKKTKDHLKQAGKSYVSSYKHSRILKKLDKEKPKFWQFDKKANIASKKAYHKASKESDKIQGARNLSQANKTGFTKGTKRAIATAALLTAAYLAYKKVMQSAVVKCRGSQNPKQCRTQYRNKAIQNQITVLQAKIGACAYTATPELCKNSINKKIAKLKVKIAKNKEGI